MPIAPTTYFRNKRVFVDREACTQAFRENIRKLGTQRYNVLYYHGIAGIGKSKLQKKLQIILDEEFPDIFWVSIDLNTKTYREIGTFLITLRNKIQEKYKTKFYLFNKVHAIYWKKLHPEIPLQKENYPCIKEDGSLRKMIDVLNGIKPGPLKPIPIKLTFDTLNNAPDNIRRFFKEQFLDIGKLTAMETHELEKLLPGFFAADFTDYLGSNTNAYIFIDTYEALWEGLRDIGSYHEKDEWIRENLIPNMSRVSWVICGREKLLWLECDADWKLYLETQPIDELEDSYCMEFLEDCGIENKDIRDIIVNASEGVPYYLNLSVDTFEKINSTRQPVHEDFGRTKPEIFNTFVKYLNSNEIRALKVLSAPNFWDIDLFEKLMKKFDTGFPTSAFSELIQYSFIKQDNEGKYSIHQLMRTSLQEYQTSEDRKKVHHFMMEYYNDKLKGINFKVISSEHEIALIEAYYHAKHVFDVYELVNFLTRISTPFFKAAFWKLIIPMHEDSCQVIEEKFGNDNIVLAASLNTLAGLYQDIGNFDKALLRYERALQVIEKTNESLTPMLHECILNNFGQFYQEKKEFKESLKLYEMALIINQRENKSDNLNVATIYNNQAGIYQAQGNLSKALQLYLRAYNIRKNFLGQEHLEVANVLNNIACLYEDKGNYEEALKLFLQSLDIREKNLGKEHPFVANTVSNLASLYVKIGDYKEAMRCFQRSLKIYANRNDTKHPRFTRDLSSLGSLCTLLGNYEDGILFCCRALLIQENTIGPTHPDIVETLNNLAGLYKCVGKFEEALQLYLRALKITICKYGRESLETAQILNNLSELYSCTGKYKKGIFICKKALKIRKSILGNKHPYVATTLNNLGLLYYQIEEWDKVLPLYQESLAIYENSNLKKHSELIPVLCNIADYYKFNQEFDKSIECGKRALHIARDKLGLNHPYFIVTKLSLISLLNELEIQLDHK
jgi:Tfp pilus assembly protein PilF